MVKVEGVRNTLSLTSQKHPESSLLFSCIACGFIVVGDKHLQRKPLIPMVSAIILRG